MDEQTTSSVQVLEARIGLGRALKFTGVYQEAKQILKDAFGFLSRPSVMTEYQHLVPHWIHGLRELADIHTREGAPGEASAQLKAGLDILEEAGVQEYLHLRPLLVERLAWLHLRQGELEEALDPARSGTRDLELESIDDPMTLASLYNTMGGVLWHKGNLTEAAGYVELRLTLYQSLGYSWGMANAYSNLGVLYYRRGDWAKALEVWEQALTLRQRIGDIQHQAFTLNNPGFLHTLLGGHELARQDLEQGLILGEHLGDDWIVAQSLVSLSLLDIVESRFPESVAHAEAALHNAQSIRSSEIEVQARWILALAHAQAGDLDIIGKSRLIREFVASLDSSRYLIWAGQCSP